MTTSRSSSAYCAQCGKRLRRPLQHCPRCGALFAGNASGLIKWAISAILFGISVFMLYRWAATQ